MQKSNLFPLLTLCLFALSLVACRKNDDGGDSDYYVSFKVDGTEYRVEDPLAYGTTFSDTYGIYAVYNKDNATKDDDRLLYIILEDSHTEGQHLLTPSADTDKGIWIVGDGATDDQEFFT